MGSIGGGMGVPGSSSHLPPQLGVSPQTQQQQQQQQSVDGPASAKKKKRRPDGESPTVEEKRTKTGRACDACVSADLMLHPYIHHHIVLHRASNASASTLSTDTCTAIQEDPMRYSPRGREYRRSAADLRALQAVQHRVHVLPSHHGDQVQEATGTAGRGVDGSDARGGQDGIHQQWGAENR